jgi:hypothetical protein
MKAKPPGDYPEDGWYRDARATYLTPRATAGGNCVGCHDIGAFKHSPFIDQLDIVPTNKSKTMPYLPVGSVFKEAFRSRQFVDVTTDPIEGSNQRCTTCHRMTAGGNSCSQFLDAATGHDPAPRSELGRTFPNAAWMPLDHGLTSAGAYNETFGKHIERMKCCCAKPNAKGCKTRPFGPTLEEIGAPAQGRMLPDFKAADPSATESCL